MKIYIALFCVLSVTDLSFASGPYTPPPNSGNTQKKGEKKKEGQKKDEKNNTKDKGSQKDGRG